MIRWNVRTPEEVTGDIRSQVAANHVCAEKIIELMKDEDLDTLDDLADEIIRRTEASMRSAVSEDSRTVCIPTQASSKGPGKDRISGSTSGRPCHRDRISWSTLTALPHRWTGV